MADILMVHYDEIALKGGNRTFFEDTLVRRIRAAVKDVFAASVQKYYGRIVVPLPERIDRSRVITRLAVLPGVRYVLEGMAGENDWESIVAAVLRTVDRISASQRIGCFGVRVKKAEQDYPMRSQEMERRLGTLVQEKTGWDVNLRCPDVWVRIELVNQKAFVCTHRYDGPGGLPSGVSGRGLVLLSGGIDSPVAAWMMMTRGLHLSFVHFHSVPYTSRASQEKVLDLVEILTRFQPKIDLLMVPFADPIQRTIVSETPERYRVILYRRFMMRLAALSAEKNGDHCLITGESLGQVASQTIENLTTVQAVASLPVLRPLVGMCKPGIIELARRIGTYETSIAPHEDCCSYLMPARPATRTSPAELETVEAQLQVKDLVERAWKQRELHSVQLSATR